MMHNNFAQGATNHNEVMNFDPVDGRDLRGRRDASNPRQNFPPGVNVKAPAYQQQQPFSQGMSFNSLVAKSHEANINL